MDGSTTFDPVSGQWSNLVLRPKAGTTQTVPNEWVGPNYDSTDKFANIVFYDSLKFKEKPANSGTFTFGDTFDTRWFVYCPSVVSDKNFMPLKDKGFKYDASSRWDASADPTCFSHNNFAFTMEIHRTFVYKSGMVFTFTGDDDVWVYINNHLRIDLGGAHTPQSNTLDLSTCGLDEGKTYPFDFFYCERCVPCSNIFITTNMLILSPPQAAKRSWKRDYGNLD